MGESVASSTLNVFSNSTVLPQPALSLLMEDDDEPPSTGLRASGRPKMIGEGEEDSTFPRAIDFGIQDIVNATDRQGLERPRSSGISRLRAIFTPGRLASPRPTYSASFIATFRYSPINFMLNPTSTFIFSGLGIMPLAALLGLGTEQIALSTKQSVGGLLNASLGNLIEMIIAGIALQEHAPRGLLSNLLLVLGCSFVGIYLLFVRSLFVSLIDLIVGGFRFQQQRFQAMVAQLNSSLLIVSVISMTIPAAFHLYLESRLTPGTEMKILLELSRGTAIILILITVNTYIPALLSVYSHNYLFLDTEQEPPSRSNSNECPLPTTVTSTIRPYSSSCSTSSLSSHEEKPKMNNISAVILLVIVTVLAYITSEYLVDSLDGMVAAHPKISKEWITLIVIPIISNAAEHTTAVIVASKGKFDLAMSVAVGSCIQIALFVIPFLVLLGWIMGKPLTMLFDPLETLVLFLSVLVVKFSVEDGKSHWMSGIVLMSVYILVAVSFWYFPGDTVRLIQGQALECT
ncbi:Sodium/calcium exchanger protein-domain-containing protein [Pholiota molesta]|nr:Sodium/calcium exchanger protein-domain-containing protein [Pholiota molesta]